MAVDVNVTSGTPLATSDDSAIIDITFTNSAIITYAANSNLYYNVLLTDSTPTTPLTLEVTFVVPVTEQGEIAVDTPKNFVIENTSNMVFPITGSLGKICYKSR